MMVKVEPAETGLTFPRPPLEEGVTTRAEGGCDEDDDEEEAGVEGEERDLTPISSLTSAEVAAATCTRVG